MAKIYNDKSGSWYGANNGLSEKQQEFNAKSVVNYFKNLSDIAWTDSAICAILGNMSFESSVNPQRQEVGGTGYGLVQWTPKNNCINRAKKIGRYKTYDTMYTQLAIIDYELKHNIQWAKTSDYNISFKDFATDNTKDLKYLTGAWLKNYERPADQSQANIDRRYNGEGDHIGANEWANRLDFNISPDSGSIAGFLTWCETIANDNNYLYKLGAGHGVSWDYDGKYFDCSSFISFGLHNGGGYDLETQFQTATQEKDLKAIGFDVRAFKSKSQLKKGDIVFYKGHTEAVFDCDNTGAKKLVGAHSDDLPKDKQISIDNWYDGGWTHFARPFESGHKPRYKKTNKSYCVFVYPKRKRR